MTLERVAARAANGRVTSRPSRELVLTLAAADPASTAVWTALAEEHLTGGRLIDAHAAAGDGSPPRVGPDPRE